ILGYATHPMVASCLLLEHGCEKTHNAFWHNQMRQSGIDPDTFGWASIQLDGGIQPVMAKIAEWFTADLDNNPPQKRIQAGLEQLHLGLVTDGRLSPEAARQLTSLIRWIVSSGGSVIVPQQDDLLSQSAFLNALKLPPAPGSTLRYARQPVKAGLHIMERPSRHWSETMTGLGATGVDIVLAMVEKREMPGHPFIPVVQAVEETAAAAAFPQDLDIILRNKEESAWANQLLARLVAVLSGAYTPCSSRQHQVDFQITRGLLGVSL
ncbi:MAG: hypothetical protein WAM60_25825, partial [Candidatus Promineifilaceae bacterium]